MKILHVTTHMNIGGIGNYIMTLSKALKARGAGIIVASCGGNLEDELEKFGIRHVRLDIRTKNWMSPKVIGAVFKLRALIKEEKIDIIHAHSRVSQVAVFFASHLARVPYVTTCHGFFKKRLRGLFDTWGSRVVAISGAVKKHLENDLGVREERIELILSGVDADRFARYYSKDEVNTMKRPLGLNDGPVIGTIGRLSAVKGQKFLIEAMRYITRRLPEAQCLIVGDGEEKKALEDLAGSFGIGGNVHFISSVVDTERILPVIDVFVFPSIKEGLGIALLEALAAGRACVASRIGGIEDIVKNGFNGLLTDVGDAGGIAQAVVKLLEDQDERARMGERGRDLVREAFTLDRMADKVLQLYGEVIESNA